MNRTFRRRLEQAVVERLRAGQPPDSLLTELKTRTDPATADALLEQSEKRFRQASAEPANPGLRVVGAAPYAWATVLVLQQVIVLTTLSSANAVGGSDGMRLWTLLVVLKTALLLGAAFVNLRWANGYTAAAFGLAILYAFPFGLILDTQLTGLPVAGLGTLVSTSAFLSYGAATIVGALYWRRRLERSPPSAAEAFD